MRAVYFDITNLYITRSITGIQRVVRSILPFFIENQCQYKVKIIFYDETRGKYAVFKNEDIQKLVRSLDKEPLNPEYELDITEFQKNDIFLDIDSVWNVFHKRSWLYPLLKQQGVIIFSYLYDLIPIKFPQYTHKNTLRNYTLYVSAVCAYSDLVFADSRSTERDFIELKEKIGVKRHIPTVVTRLSGDFSLAIDNDNKVENRAIKRVLNKKYILFVGTLEPRKNQALLLESFDKLASEHKDLNIIYVGKEGWDNQKLIDRLTKHKLYKKRIHWFQGIGDNNLQKLYQNCFLSVYVSSYEGYGLPIVESLQYDKPVIASNNSSMFEAGGIFADYITYETEREN